MQELTKRQQKALQTKEKIYDAAIKLFEKNGYENVLIEDITKAAKVATGTFYLYYKSKKDLMYATIEKYNQCSDKAYERVREMTDFKEKLLKYVEYYYEEVQKVGRQMLRALVGNNILDGADVINAPERSIYRVMNILLQEGMEQGALSKEYCLAYYEQIIVAALLGVDYYWCTRDEPELVDLISVQMEILVEGLTRL